MCENGRQRLRRAPIRDPMGRRAKRATSTRSEGVLAGCRAQAGSGQQRLDGPRSSAVTRWPSAPLPVVIPGPWAASRGLCWGALSTDHRPSLFQAAKSRRRRRFEGCTGGVAANGGRAAHRCYRGPRRVDGPMPDLPSTTGPVRSGGAAPPVWPHGGRGRAAARIGERARRLLPRCLSSLQAGRDDDLCGIGGTLGE